MKGKKMNQTLALLVTSSDPCLSQNEKEVNTMVTALQLTWHQFCFIVVVKLGPFAIGSFSTKNRRSKNWERFNTTSDQLVPNQKGCFSGCRKAEKDGSHKGEDDIGLSTYLLAIASSDMQPKKSDILNDERVIFYRDSTNYIKLYTCDIGLLGGQYLWKQKNQIFNE